MQMINQLQAITKGIHFYKNPFVVVILLLVSSLTLKYIFCLVTFFLRIAQLKKKYNSLPLLLHLQRIRTLYIRSAGVV